MRKLLYTITGLAALITMASCNKEAEGSVTKGSQLTATFTVTAPGTVATKAISDGSAATSLIFAAYDESGNYLSDLSAYGNAHITGSSSPWTVTVPVVKDMTYKFVFFAASTDAFDASAPTSTEKFYQFDASNKLLKVDYTKLDANDDDADAFYAAVTQQIGDSFTLPVSLQRPIAQVNVGASDITEAAYSINTTTMTTGIVLTGVYSQMNLLDGTLAGSTGDVTYSQATRVSETSQFVTGYDRVAMVYVLAGASQTSNATINVTAKGVNNDTDHPITRSVPNIPLRRGYRTNILGNIFTNNFTFTVTTDANFTATGSYDQYIPDYVSTATNLTTFNALLADGITAAALEMDGEASATYDVVLPDTDKEVTLYFIGDFRTNGNTINVNYSTGAKPSKVNIYAPQLHELNGELIVSTATILDHSYIETGVFATAGSTLVIEPQAYYGNLTITKGSLKVEGTVTTANISPSNPAEEIVVNVIKDATENINGTVQVLNVASGVVSVTSTAADGVSEPDPESGEETTVENITVTGGSTTITENAVVTNVTAKEDTDAGTAGSVTIADGASVENLVQKGDATVVIENEDNVENTNVEDEEKVSVKYVVQIVGGDKYDSLAAAMEAAESGATIVVLSSHSIDAGIVVDKNITIDLQGKELTFEADEETLATKYPAPTGLSGRSGAFVVNPDSSVDLSIVSTGTDSNDQTVKGIITVDALIHHAVSFNNSGKLELKDLELNNSHPSRQSILIVEGQDASLCNLEITATDGAGGIYFADNTTGTITNCVVHQSENNPNAPWNCSALSISDGGKVTVEGGSFTGVIPFFIFNSGGEATLKNASFTWIEGGSYGQKDIYLEYGASTHDAVVYIYDDCELSLGYDAVVPPVGYSPYASNGYVWFVNAQDGALKLTKQSEYNYAIEHEWPLLQPNFGTLTDKFITSGSFNADPSAYVLEGYVAELIDGVYVVDVAPELNYDGITGLTKRADNYEVSTPAAFNHVFSTPAILKPSSKQVTIKLTQDIDLSGQQKHTLTNLNGASYVVTLDGQGHTLKGLQEELLEQGVNGAVVNVKNLTFDTVNISKSDDKYVAVIMGYADCSGGINVSNVTFKDVTLSGKKHIGVVYGYGAGWDKQNDGPVFMDSTIDGCVFENCSLTTEEGSAGIVAGHVSGNAWTLHTLKSSTVKDCTITCGEANKAGVLYGTIGVAGTQAYGKTGGTYVQNCKWFNNSVTANGSAVERSFGRVASTGGKYYIDGNLVAYNAGNGDVVSGDIYEKTE